MSLLDWSAVLVGIVLQSMVVSTMLKGSFRQYPFVFSYLVFSLLSTVVQFSFKYYFGPASREFVRAYWTGDFLGTCLILMVIIHLIRMAMKNHKYRDTVYWGLMFGVVATAGVSVFLMQSFARGFSWGKWMTEVSRNYYFSAVILNAILWFTLMRVNHENRQVYLLTSGLGLKLTGAAIAHALRLSGVLFLANQFLMLTYLANLYVWYVALKRLPADTLAVASDEGPAPSDSVEPTTPLKAPRP